MNLINQPVLNLNQPSNNPFPGITPVQTNPSNNDQLNNIFSNINLVNTNTQPLNLQTNNTLNLFNESAPQTSSNLKQVYKNNDLTLYSTTKFSDKMNSNITFSLSNNVNSQIQNIKLQYSFPKYIDKTINQPSQNFLSPLSSFGIQQVITI
jgi:Adaptin C-terminal domain